MALHDEEMNRRREKREAMRRKQEAERKRMKITLIAAAVILVLVGAGMFFLIRQNPAAQSDAALQQTQQETEATRATQETQPAKKESDTTTTIHIKAAGDLNVTDAVVDSGMQAGVYDYTRSFIDVAAILSDADLTVLNFEGNVCGEPYGTATTSAPKEILDGLRNAGVDLLQMANSCSINNGLIGLNATLQAVRNAGLEPLGAYSSTEEFEESGGYTICDVQGVRVAFVAFTKGVGGRGMPAGNEDCVNLLYTDYATEYTKIDRDGIRAVLKNVAKEEPDITIAMLHWGSEYNDVVSDSQTSIISLMQKEGVDVIVGTHSHMVQKIEFDQAKGTLVAYSLGDFFGDASRGGTNYSIILDMEITKDNTSGTTKVTNFSYTPIYTQRAADCVDGDHRVVRIQSAMNAYNNNFVDKITQTANDSMIYSLTRIEARVTGIEPTEAEDSTDATETGETETTEAETTAATTESTAEATTEASTEADTTAATEE